MMIAQISQISQKVQQSKIKNAECLGTLKQSLFLFQYPKLNKKCHQTIENPKFVDFNRRKHIFELEKLVHKGNQQLIEKRKNESEFLEPLQSYGIYSRKTLIRQIQKSTCSHKIDQQIIQSKKSINEIKPIHNLPRLSHVRLKSLFIKKSIKTEVDPQVQGIYILDLLNKKEKMKTVSRVSIMKDQEIELFKSKETILPYSINGR